MAANAQLAPLHNRMPAILSPEEWDVWLDPEAPGEAVGELLRPLQGELTLHPVTPRMNHYAYADADAVAPTAIEPDQEQLALPW